LDKGKKIIYLFQVLPILNYLPLAHWIREKNNNLLISSITYSKGLSPFSTLDKERYLILVEALALS
jgi:hypothetical protein